MTLYSIACDQRVLLQLFLVDELPKVVDILSHVNCGKWLRNVSNRTSDIAEGMSDAAQAPTRSNNKVVGCRSFE